jgi:CO dehydrogenase maturation factor
MKIAISGKGGVGKTTLAAALARLYADQGNKVIAIDCDPDANLALTLGFPENEKITPICKLKDTIAERTGAKTQTGIFKLNPKVDDIPEKYSKEHNGVRVMVMGSVKKAAGGCLCPENAFVKSLIAELLIGRKDIVILDMVAGVEHLGRGTASGVDVMLIVAQPDKRSMDTAANVKKLTEELKIKNCILVGNKIKNQEDKDYIKNNAKDFGNIEFLRFDEQMATSRKPQLDKITRDAKQIKEKIESLVK